MSRKQWATALPIAIWLVAVLWLASDAGLSMPRVLFIVYSVPVILFIWLFARIVRFVQRHGPILASTHPSRKLLLLEPAVILLAGLLVLAGIPFTARFWVSKPFLERYVEEVLVNGAPQTPKRVGLFEARQTEVVAEKTVRILTTGCGLDDCGVVYSPGEPPRLGEDHYSRIANGWWRWHQSW